MSNTTCTTLLVDFEEEMKNTRKLLERVPLTGALRDYKPHPKSMALDRLATHLAELPSWIEMGLKVELFRLEADYKPTIATTTEELLAILDRSAEQGRAAIAATNDEEMKKDWTFQFGDAFSFTDTRPKVLRSFLNHLIHHRAQLGVYLRMNNIPIPGVYGPSADEH